MKKLLFIILIVWCTTTSIAMSDPNEEINHNAFLSLTPKSPPTKNELRQLFTITPRLESNIHTSKSSYSDVYYEFHMDANDTLKSIVPKLDKLCQDNSLTSITHLIKGHNEKICNLVAGDQEHASILIRNTSLHPVLRQLIMVSLPFDSNIYDPNTSLYPILTSIANDQNELLSTRIFAIRSIRKIPSSENSLIIISLLQDSKPQIRRESIKALKPPYTLNQLKIISNELLKGDYLTQIIAARTLSKSEAPLALKSLIDYLESYDANNIGTLSTKQRIVRMNVVRSLGSFGEDKAQLLLKKIFCNDKEHVNTKKAAVEAIANTCSEENVYFLINALEFVEPGLSIVIARSLVKMERDDQIPILEKRRKETQDAYEKLELNKAIEKLKSLNISK